MAKIVKLHSFFAMILKRSMNDFIELITKESRDSFMQNGARNFMPSTGFCSSWESFVHSPCSQSHTSRSSNAAPQC